MDLVPNKGWANLEWLYDVEQDPVEHPIALTEHNTQVDILTNNHISISIKYLFCLKKELCIFQALESSCFQWHKKIYKKINTYFGKFDSTIPVYSWTTI